MKYFLAALVCLSCNSKHSQLDKFYSEKEQLKKKQDSLRVAWENETVDSLRWTLSGKIDALTYQIRKIDYSIDSLSKY